MPVRAMWKGVIRFGAVSVPIKLYAAAQDRAVHFRLLHQADQAPVQQKMVHPKTGEPVPPEAIQRGFETETGEIIVLNQEELKALEPAESREIRITRFIDPARVNHQWYDRPYYMGPDTDRKAYFALAEALRRQGVQGIAQWTMRKKSYLGALQANGGYLKMITLHPAEEIVDVSGLQAPRFRELSRQELQMAQQLVAMLEADFDPSQYEDEYRRRVYELMRTKARGETVEFKKARPRQATVVSLEEVLKQSISKAREEKKHARG
jgi:DNA end-binding protein Ku